MDLKGLQDTYRTREEYFERKRIAILATVTPIPPSEPITPIGPPPIPQPSQPIAPSLSESISSISPPSFQHTVSSQRESIIITQNNTNSQQTRSNDAQNIASVAISLPTDTSPKQQRIQEPEQENTLCSICMSIKKTILIGPCNHVDLCVHCAVSYGDFTTTKKCPRCRGTVLSVTKIFT